MRAPVVPEGAESRMTQRQTMPRCVDASHRSTVHTLLAPRDFDTLTFVSRLGDRIGAKIDAGLLPADLPEKLVAGHGHEDQCSACDAPILPSQVEWSIADEHRVTHRFHLGCHGIWVSQLTKRARLRRRSPLQRVAIGLTTYRTGVCVRCLGVMAVLDRGDVDRILAQLESVVMLTFVDDMCSICGEQRHLARL